MFETFELSRFLGRPVRLFVFQRQSVVWRFCNADRNLVIGGNTYLAAPIDRGEIKQTAERAKDKLTITLAYLRDPNAPEFPATQALGDNWHPYIPSDSITVTCLATHYGDTDPPAVEWSGIVTQPSFTDIELTLTCEQSPAIAKARNQGPKWQRACWKTVYSTGLRGCNLALDAFEVSTTLSAVNGLDVGSSAFADAPLALDGGWIEWTRLDGLVERRSIMEHSLGNLRLLYGAADLAVGLAVIARPGCQQTWAACVARGNTINYGGAIYKPRKDPTETPMSWT
ncbi:MAG: DUF2163 domain-containing protein [Immundisolibacter sp.]|uniref:phage BR0599 family protein n=1 Tax=Immundisolibacter sp. TaxID=1934948 RepID=UPI00199A00EA|nr:DUF2163 domain-containing protein [Immundisolibacter sp.]MBC7162692.1 DUF2163 domain-containing protein [Immundisolibacter sp.]